MIANRWISLADASASLPEFDGADLRLTALSGTHGVLELLASGLARGRAQLWFQRTQYLCVGSEMRHARLRLASTAATEQLRRSLPGSLGAALTREEHLVIECDAGRFSLWARRIAVHWADEAGRMGNVVGDLSGSLWPGGPPLAGL